MKNTIKTIRFSLLFALVACLMFSCQKKATYLNADVAAITVAAAGGEGKVALHSDGSKFELVSAPEWAGVQLTDSVLTYSVGKNANAALLEGNIVVANGDMQITISMVQGTPATTLKPAKDSVTFGYEGGTDTIDVATDGMLVTAEATSGFTASYSDGKVMITANPTDGKSRVEGKVTLHADELTAEIATSVKTKVCQRCNGTGKVKCTRCKGDGLYSDGYVSIGCERCGGCGYNPSYYEKVEMANAGYRWYGSGTIRCPECKGKK